MALAKATWSRTPDTWKHEYQFIQNKSLISFTDGYKTYLNNTWESVNEPLDSTKFIDRGMDNLTKLDRVVQELSPMNMEDKTSILFTNGEVGKVYQKTIDLQKYFDIRSIKTNK